MTARHVAGILLIGLLGYALADSSVSGAGAVQFGTGNNPTPNTMQFQSFNFGNANGTLTPQLVTPSLLYSAAATALPTCAVAMKGTTAVVSDATSPTFMGTYSSGGTITAAVICSFNGTTYSWLTH